MIRLGEPQHESRRAVDPAKSLAVLTQTRTVALVRAIDGSGITSPAFKRLAAAMQVSWEEFAPAWLDPESMPAAMGLSLAWVVIGLQGVVAEVRAAALAVLRAEQDHDHQVRRDDAEREARLLADQWTTVLTSPLPSDASNIPVRLASAEIHCLRALARGGLDVAGLRSRTSHFTQSIALACRSALFPSPEECAEIDEQQADLAQYGRSDDAEARESASWRWAGMDATLEEWASTLMLVHREFARLLEDSSADPPAALETLATLTSTIEEYLGVCVPEGDAAGSPLPKALDAWIDALVPASVAGDVVPLIMRKWAPNKRPGVNAAFIERVEEIRRRAAGEGRLVPDRAAIKHMLISSAFFVVWGLQHDPWLPRRDSRAEPSVPSTWDLENFVRWLRIETIHSAEADLLDLPYPQPADRYGQRFEIQRNGVTVWSQRDSWESGEAGDPGAPDDPDDDVRDPTPAWDQHAGLSDGFDSSSDTDPAAVEETVSLLLDSAPPRMREYLIAYLTMARSGTPSWAAVARQFGVSAGAVRTQVKRLHNELTKSA